MQSKTTSSYEAKAPWLARNERFVNLIDGTAETRWGRYLLEIAESEGLRFYRMRTQEAQINIGSYDDGHIFRRRGLYLADDADEAVLVHELAHHRQRVKGAWRRTSGLAGVLLEMGLEADATIWQNLHYNDSIYPDFVIERPDDYACNLFNEWMDGRYGMYREAAIINHIEEEDINSGISGIFEIASYPFVTAGLYLATSTNSVSAASVCFSMAALTTAFNAKAVMAAIDDELYANTVELLHSIAELPFEAGNYLDHPNAPNLSSKAFLSGKLRQHDLAEIEDIQKTLRRRPVSRVVASSLKTLGILKPC